MDLSRLIYTYFDLIGETMSSNLQIQRICDHCDTTFMAKTTKTRFCSHDCNRKYYKAHQRALKVQASAAETLEKRVTHRAKEQSTKTSKEFMTVNDVAEILEFSRDAIYDLINSGRLKAYRPSARKTRIMREDLLAYLERRDERITVAPKAQTETDEQAGPLSRESCYTIPELINIFGKERDSLYRILRDGEVANIKIGREVFYSRVESDRLFRKFSSRKHIGFVGFIEEVEANRRLAKKKFAISDCYTMDECITLFDNNRANLYSLFSRREVPKIKQGVQTYYLKKSVDKILRHLEKGGKSE